MYEIRGLAVSSLTNNDSLDVFLRDLKSGDYATFKYTLPKKATVTDVLTFLMLRLNCHIKDILIADHVSFSKVGIPE